MFERLRLHPERPQARLIRHAAACIREGVVAVVPTESTYALMCLPHCSDAQQFVRRLRKLDEKHLWSLVCESLSQAAHYVHMDNPAHRILRRSLPGPYTFVLRANNQLPRRIFGKRRDIGIRIPEHTVCRMLLAELGEPMLATTLQFPDEAHPATDPDLFIERLKGLNAVVLDAGWGGTVPTTVVDLCSDVPELLRQGVGEWEP